MSDAANVMAASRRNELRTGHVTDIHRARLLSAAVETIDELGYQGMTVAQVIARARVSRKTFYDAFDNREDCFLAAFEQTHHRAWHAASEACDQQAGWREMVRHGLGRLLALIEEEPGLAKLWIVEALGAGDMVLRRRAEALDQFARVIDRGRFAGNAARQPPRVAALGVVGGVFAVLHARMLTEADRPPTGLLNPLMSIIVLPYLGPQAAKRELDRPVANIPRRRRPARPTRSHDPLDGLKIRLTYRTVRVLMAIGSSPGSSNRAVAEAAGVLDEGQISKLLSRLAGLDLIENDGDGQKKGAANEWQLTARGARLERATRTHAAR
jgi:AcrR family transcriptional regulator